MTQAEFKFRRGNPDVLTSIANLSNDEVFTPPEFANQMLDTLQEAWAKSNNGANIWEDSSVTFLDPFTKSGVFLREITERLTHGLEEEIPDLQERVNHILTKQVFGIGITQLTALLARRSVYCSKWANGEHSIVTAFDNPDGNIWFERTEHTWVGGKDKIIVTNDDGFEETVTTDGKCKYCGANQRDYDRGLNSETHAYSFIHSNEIGALIKSIFGEKMKFDVIVGNPPYQLSDAGNSSSSSPIYQLFIQQAKLLDPTFMSFVVPARWYSGGKGLDSFRLEMLEDNQIAVLHDFFAAEDVFPGVDISGGVCYFLWDRNHKGSTIVVNHINGEVNIAQRELKIEGLDYFIRFNTAIDIYDKVRSKGEESFADSVSARKPFGLPTNEKISKQAFPNSVNIFAYPDNGFVSRDIISKNQDAVDKYKVLISKSYGERGSFPYLVIGKPFIADPGFCCTESYIMIRVCDTKEEAENVISYLDTRFVRFLILLLKNTQDATSKVYSLVPDQDFNVEWSDEELIHKYELTEKEVEFIHSMIRPRGD